MKLIVGWMVCLLLGSVVGCKSHSPSSQQAASLTRLQLGLAYLARGALQAAQQNLIKAREAAPDNYQTQLGMALYQQQVGDNEGATASYQQAMKLAPNEPRVMNNYGAFLCSLGHYVAAQQQFTTAIQIAYGGQMVDSFENAGYCFLKAGQVEEARGSLHQALKQAPNKGAQLVARASQAFDQGEYGDARLMLETYNYVLPASAESLWLQIRFAVLDGHQMHVVRYGKQLARSFPQSKQYQQFLANEY